MKKNLIIQSEFNIVGRGLVFTVIPSENNYKYVNFNSGDIVTFKNKSDKYEIVGVEMFRQNGKIVDDNPIGLNVKVYKDIDKDETIRQEKEKMLFESKGDLRDFFNINKREYNKYKVRVRKIVTDSGGDLDKQEKLAIHMANIFTDIDNVYTCYLVALELNLVILSDVFLDRFKELAPSVKNSWKERINSFLSQLK